MRTKLLLILALPVVLASCIKSESKPDCGPLSNTVAPEAEVASLQNYLTTNSIEATKHPTGLFYSISQPGTTTVPFTVCTAVMVKYKGMLTDGTGFDSSYVRNPNGIVFTLGGLIKGWQIGIPLIKKGGSVRLFVPPSLAYGATANGSIPANSNLIFDIELLDVQN